MSYTARPIPADTVSAHAKAVTMAEQAVQAKAHALAAGNVGSHVSPAAKAAAVAAHKKR